MTYLPRHPTTTNRVTNRNGGGCGSKVRLVASFWNEPRNEAPQRGGYGPGNWTVGSGAGWDNRRWSPGVDRSVCLIKQRDIPFACPDPSTLAVDGPGSERLRLDPFTARS